MLKAIITEVPASGNKRYNVGVKGIAPSGVNVNRARFLIGGPWCRSTAGDKAKRLQDDLDHNRIGHLLGWHK
jgi:hypothetical protein